LLKKILTPLDNSAPGLAAQQYAIDLAQQHKCHLTGIGILDTPWITAAQPEPLGGRTYKIQRDDVVIQQSHDHVSTIINEFDDNCSRSNVAHSSVSAEGFPATEIEKLSHEHDLIIIGQTTDFHFDLDEDSDITVKHVARDNPRPVIIVPANAPQSDKVTVAYDGSLQASRSLHMFLLLGISESSSIEIVSINKDIEVAEALAQQAAKMCHIYDRQTSHYPIASSDDPAQTLLSFINNRDTGLLVMGGFSHTFIREALFGSNTKTLLKQCKVPIFIHH